MGEERSISCIPRWKHTIEKVDPQHDGTKNVLRGAYPHQITGSILWKKGCGPLQHIKHHRFRFSHTETTDGIPLKIHLDQRSSAFFSQVTIHAPLNDPEERRTFLLPHLKTPSCPTGRQGGRGLYIIIRRRIGDTLV